MLCTGDDGACDRDAKRRGLCWGHLKRLQRKSSQTGPLRPRRYANRWKRLEEAFLHYLVEVDDLDEAGKRKAQSRVLMALEAYRAACPHCRR